MKTIIYFILTCCVSTGAFFAATNMKNPFPVFTIAFSIWVLFFWGWHRRIKRRTVRRSMERQFEDYMRAKFTNRY
jgi:hypothetical protein